MSAVVVICIKGKGAARHGTLQRLLATRWLLDAEYLSFFDTVQCMMQRVLLDGFQI